MQIPIPTSIDGYETPNAESLKPRALLQYLTAHSINKILSAKRPCTLDLLYRFQSTIWHGYDEKKSEEDTEFNTVWRQSCEHFNELTKVYDYDPDSYEKSDLNIRFYASVLNRADDFLNFCYIRLPEVNDDLRHETDLMFSGLILNALHFPNFRSLCTNPDLLPDYPTLDQKMIAELDPKAFFSFCLSQTSDE